MTGDKRMDKFGNYRRELLRKSAFTGWTNSFGLGATGMAQASDSGSNTFSSSALFSDNFDSGDLSFLIICFPVRRPTFRTGDPPSRR